MLIEFVDLFVGNSSTSIGPIVEEVTLTDIALPVDDAVDFDITAWWPAVLCSIGAVGCIGVRDAQVFMAGRIGIFVVDIIKAFGCFFITFKMFVPYWCVAERYAVDFLERGIVVDIQFTKVFNDHNTVYAFV